jgi:hypothetical protein
MTDADLLRGAIAASGLSARRFAMDVLNMDERTMRYWLDGRALMKAGSVRVVCRAITVRPALVTELVEAHAWLVKNGLE